MDPNLKNLLSNSTKTNMQHFYCLIMTTLEPSKMELQDVCSYCSSRSSLWVPGGKLHKYNNLLFNLLFVFMDGISRSKSISRYGKIHVSLKY